MSIYDLTINELTSAASSVNNNDEQNTYFNINMSNDGSIFNMDPNKGNDADSDAAHAQASAAIASGEGLEGQAALDAKNAEGITDDVTQNIAMIINEVEKNESKIKHLDKGTRLLLLMLKEYQDKIDSLQDEIDKGSDNTGTGTGSAFSLTLGGATAEPGTPADGDSASRSSDKEGEIALLLGKIGANQAKIKQNTIEGASSKSYVDKLISSADAKYKTAAASAADASARSEQSIKTSKVITTIGGAVTTIGMGLMVFLPTAAIGKVLMIIGGVATALGTKISTSANKALSSSEKAATVANSASSTAQNLGTQFTSKYGAKKV